MLQALKIQADELIQSAKGYGLELVVEGDRRRTTTYETFIAKAKELLAEYETEIQFAFECAMFLASSGQKVGNALKSDRAVGIYKFVIRFAIWLTIEMFDFGARTVEAGRRFREVCDRSRQIYSECKSAASSPEELIVNIVEQVEVRLVKLTKQAERKVWDLDAVYQEEIVESVKRYVRTSPLWLHRQIIARSFG